MAKQVFKPRKLKSPLLWIGGKTLARPQIEQHFPPGLIEMVSPFFGGGGMEVYLASQGTRVHGYDADPRLVNFWRYALRDGVRVRMAAREFWPIDSAAKQRELREQMMTEPMGLRLAAIFYAVSRASFYGDVYGSGAAINSPRFTRRSMHDLNSFKLPTLSVENASFQVSLARHPGLFAYVDPPYLMDREYYAPEFRGFPHEELARLLKRRGNWIMSNADNAEVRDLYAGHTFVSPTWYRGTEGKGSPVNELLVFSRDLQPKS